MRHLISGVDCAIAGAAMATPATPTPLALMKSRRFMNFPPLGDVTCRLAFVSRLYASMGHPLPAFHDALSCRNAKSPACAAAGRFVYYLRLSLGSSGPRRCLLLGGVLCATRMVRRGCVGDDGLIALRQRIPLLQIAERVHRRTALPEAGIVVIFGDLLEAEFLVVVRSDPFGAVDGALLECRIDVAAGELLRHHADLLQHLACNAADAKLQS